MFKKSRFEVVRQTPYGPVLHRKPETMLGYEDEITLDDNELESESKREFIKKLFALGITATAGKVIYDWTQTAEENENDGLSDENKSVEAIDELPAPAFESELIGYKALVELEKDEVLFVDESNLPVGRPQKMQPYIDKRPGTEELTAENRYLYQPGNFNEAGLLEDGIAGDWLNYVKEKHQAFYPDRPIAKTFHVTVDFLKAYNTKSEPELVNKIESGEIKKYSDIVKYYSSKPVVGEGDYSRQEYVQEKIIFKDDIPEVVQTELRRLLPGLCAQESKFNASATSSAGAQGIMQFMPATWEDYGGQPNEYTSLRKQVEIAGQFISDLYRQLRTHIGHNVMDLLKTKFRDETEFEIDFMVPLVINSYNAGAARIAEAVRLYVAETDITHMPTGKDLFIAIADFATGRNDGYLSDYGSHAREYVTRIYAQAEVLNGG